MKRYQITLDGCTFDVRLLSDPRQEQVEVEIDGRALTVQVAALPDVAAAPGPLPQPAREPAVTVAPPGGVVGSPSGAVTAPLPGVIKSISVQRGQAVAVGDVLLVIEAMKMDNVIRASRGGTVEAIHAAEGRQVAHGELLIEFRR